MLRLLTPTGARPEAWTLCKRWMARQTYTGPVHWVIVDDGPQPQEPPPPREGWKIEVIRPAIKWRPGMNTQNSNLKAGLLVLTGDEPIAFIEDDEHYTADYLDRLVGELQHHEMVGQRLSRKYNLRTRRAKEVAHPWRASLCATAVRGRALQRLRGIIRLQPLLIDGVLWRDATGHLFDGAYVTGLKCMPGRGGIDSGHQPRFGDISDPQGTLLRKWLGDDATAYEEFMLQTQHTRDGEIQAYVEAYKSPAYRMGPRRTLHVAHLLERLPRGSLLDIGTGRGETLRMAAKAGHRPVQGTEVVPALLTKDVVYAQAHSMPFEDASFDNVTCFDVLEHLTEEDIEPALREMHRVARRTVTVSASERSDIRAGRELHISKRPAAQWLEVIQRCWGRSARQVGQAGASPAFQLVKG